MVLRLYKKDSVIPVLRKVNRVIFSKSGNLEVRIDGDDGYVWKKFLCGKDFHSFTVTLE